MKNIFLGILIVYSLSQCATAADANRQYPRWQLIKMEGQDITRLFSDASKKISGLTDGRDIKFLQAKKKVLSSRKTIYTLFGEEVLVHDGIVKTYIMKVVKSLDKNPGYRISLKQIHDDIPLLPPRLIRQ